MERSASPANARPAQSGNRLLDLARHETYRRVLAENLAGDLGKLVDFFANARRLHVFAALLERHFVGRDKTVLNVGCGPFASEVYVRALVGHDIVSFDYTRGFAPLYPILRNEGFLERTHFFVGDAVTVEFRHAAFDLVVMHDILYEKALSFAAMLDKYDPYLRAEGLIVFDIMNRRTASLGRLLGSGVDYRRYHVTEVSDLLKRRGYEVLEVRANLGWRGGLHGVLRRLAWWLFRLANSFTVLARKRPANE